MNYIQICENLQAAGDIHARSRCRDFGQPFVLEEVTLAAPGRDDVTVRLRAASICHSDIIFADGGWGGDLPAIYGHEGAGVIEAAGEGVNFSPDDHVILTTVRSCGTRGGCEHEFAKEGSSVKLTDHAGQPIHQGLKTAAFADYAMVHRSQVVNDKDLAFDVAAVMACGVITGFGAVANSAAMRPNSNVVVIGAGGVGLNCLQAARIRGARKIIAIDRNAGRLDAARIFGATHVVDGAKDDPVNTVSISPTGGVRTMCSSWSAPNRHEGAFALLAPGGMAVLVGIPENGVSAKVRRRLNILEKGAAVAAVERSQGWRPLVDRLHRGFRVALSGNSLNNMSSGSQRSSGNSTCQKSSSPNS